MKNEKEKKNISDDAIIAQLSRGNYQPRIGVVGAGGWGSRIVSRIDGKKPTNVTTMIINTDQQSMEVATADKKIIVGRDVTDGTGAGGFWEVGYYAGDAARKLIREGLKGHDSVVIVYGAGGGTGAGVSLVVAEVARELNMVATGIIMTPFAAEKDRVVRAQADIRRFRELVSNTIVLDNNRFIKKNITLKKAMDMTAGGILKIVESMSMEMSRAMMETIAAEVRRETQKLPTPEKLPEPKSTVKGGEPLAGKATAAEVTAADMMPHLPDDPSIT